MRIRPSILALLAACAAPPLAAQDAVTITTESAPLDLPAAERAAAPSMLMAAPPPLPLAGGDTMTFMQFEMNAPGELVTGKPYAASLTVEVHQPLMDGNAITVEHHSKVYRDAAGRTRRDDTLGAPGAEQTSVSIADPVSGDSYTLDPARRVAERLPRALERAATVASAADVGASDGAVFDVALPPPLASVAGVAPADASPALAGGIGLPADGPIRLPFPGDPRSVSLGEKTLEGVRATGTRTTVTIPANAIGNRAPIEIVTEQWYSPELDVVMLSEHRDPRVGETRYRLHDISRGDPDPALFRVPADYTVKAAGLNVAR